MIAEYGKNAGQPRFRVVRQALRTFSRKAGSLFYWEMRQENMPGKYRYRRPNYQSRRCFNIPDDTPRSGHFAQDDRGVGAAKPKGIGQNNINIAFARRDRHQIYRRFPLWVFEVDGRRHDLVADGED